MADVRVQISEFRTTSLKSDILNSDLCHLRSRHFSLWSLAMATATLNATTRSDVGKGSARKLRASLRIPGVVYGHHREATPLAIDARELEKLLGSIAAGTTVVELNLGGRVSKTLIREIQRHPFRRQVLHIDFQELVAGEKITVNVPIRVDWHRRRRQGRRNRRRGDARGVGGSRPGEHPQPFRDRHLGPGHQRLRARERHQGAGGREDPRRPRGDGRRRRAAAHRGGAAPAPAEGAVEAAAEPELIRKPKDEEEGGEGE